MTQKIHVFGFTTLNTLILNLARSVVILLVFPMSTSLHTCVQHTFDLTYASTPVLPIHILSPLTIKMASFYTKSLDFDIAKNVSHLEIRFGLTLTFSKH